MAGECYTCGGRKRTISFGGIYIPCVECCCSSIKDDDELSVNEVIEKELEGFNKKSKSKKGSKDDE